MAQSFQESKVLISDCCSASAPSRLPSIRTLHPANAFFFWLTEDLRMQIMAAFFRRLVFFNLNTMRVGVSVLPDARDLP